MTIQEILSEFDIEGKQFDISIMHQNILFAMMQKKALSHIKQKLWLQN